MRSNHVAHVAYILHHSRPPSLLGYVKFLYGIGRQCLFLKTVKYGESWSSNTESQIQNLKSKTEK
jgi:hypothetical protein